MMVRVWSKVGLVSSAMGRRLLGLLAVAMLCVVGVLSLGGVLADAAGLRAEATFITPGAHAWTAPADGTVTFDVFGAAGIRGFGSHPGLGGEAKASFEVAKDQTFEIVVGGSDGFNGGGSGNGGLDPGDGGGASDVRLGQCASSKTCGLEDRIVVGGGGGGAVFEGGAGGNGGGRAGANGTEQLAGEGATQVGGGAGFLGRFSGSFGHGGNGGEDAPGGGGGWFGGGGAAPNEKPGTHQVNGGGGGGSGFISPFAVRGSFPDGRQSGDGKVIVSFSETRSKRRRRLRALPQG